MDIKQELSRLEMIEAAYELQIPILSKRIKHLERIIKERLGEDDPEYQDYLFQWVRRVDLD